MIFSWFKKRRRARILEEPFPDAWLSYLEKNVRHYGRLTEVEQATLRDALRIFIAEKSWEGCGGLEVTDEMKVTIAAQACLLLLGLEHDYFSHVETILVYPEGFVVPVTDRTAHFVTEGTDSRIGEAHQLGAVVLAWDEVLETGQHPEFGENLVFHEFAHQLDMLDGVVDGTPPLGNASAYERWREVMTAEYQRLTEEADRGRDTLLDPYGATNAGEFFAVATEYFFDCPVELKAEHPRLYALLRDYYHQDPAARCRDDLTTGDP